MSLSRLPLYVIATLCLLIGLTSFRFLALDLEVAFPDMIGQVDNRRIAFLFHVIFAPIALIIGAFQMMPGLRRRFPKLHRWNGRIYAVSILLAGVSGLVIAANAAGGLSPLLGFGLLSALWLITTFEAVRQARARNFVSHRRWMIVSFSLTFAAVTLRLYLLGFMAAGFTYTEASVYLAWMCWVPNLVFAEIWVRRTGRDVAAPG